MRPPRPTRADFATARSPAGQARTSFDTGTTPGVACHPRFTLPGSKHATSNPQGPLVARRVAVTALFTTGARADLTPLDPVDFSATGLGAVNTILTIKSPGSLSSETDSVARNGSADVLGGDVKTGSSKTLTRTLCELGVLSADSLRVVFNAPEPGNGANGIMLDALTFPAYAATTGSLIFSASLPAPIAYADTFNGTGNSGFVFGLTSAEAAEFTAAVSASGFWFDSIRAGLSASASNATGGNETFFIANAVASGERRADPKRPELPAGGAPKAFWAVISGDLLERHHRLVAQGAQQRQFLLAQRDAAGLGLVGVDQRERRALHLHRQQQEGGRVDLRAVPGR